MIKGMPSMELVAKNTLAKATLDKKATGFAKCDQSLKLGATAISDVSLSYLRFDSTDTEKQQIKDTENKFIGKIKAPCDPIIKEYTDSFETFKHTSIEIAKSEMSLFDKLIGANPAPDDSVFANYEPSYVSMTNGGSGYVFTDGEVNQFYKTELGY